MTAPPVVLAELVPPRRKGDAWIWLLLSCPYCGRRHVHGAGIDGTVDGHRVAHCWKPSPRSDRGYFIRKAP